jgi:hypothetical protein
VVPVIAIVGLVLLVWPTPMVALLRLYRSGSVLGMTARVRHEPDTRRVEIVVRVFGAVLLVGALLLALALG